MLAYLRLVRFPLIFTAVADSWAGYFITTANIDIEWWHLPLLALASGALYAAGMIFNDLADLARDRSLHPERVLPSGYVKPSRAAGLGVVLATVAMACAFLLSTDAWGAAFTVLLLSFFYNRGTKHVRVLGSLNMGLVRASNFIMGIVVCHPFAGLTWADMTFPAVLGCYVFILTMISTLEEGESGRALFFALAVCLALSVVGINVFTVRANSALYLSFLVAGGLIGEAAILTKNFVPANVKEMVRVGVVAIIPFDAIIVVGQGYPPRSLIVFSLLLVVMVSFVAMRRGDGSRESGGLSHESDLR